MNHHSSTEALCPQAPVRIHSMQTLLGTFTAWPENWKAAGKLTLTEDGGASLELNQFVLSSETEDLPEVLRFGSFSSQGNGEILIHGETTDGKHITLPGVLITNRNFSLMGMQGMADSVTFRCPQVFIGNFRFTDPKMILDGVRLTIKWMRSWLGKSPFEWAIEDNRVWVEGLFSRPELFKIEAEGRASFHVVVQQNINLRTTSFSRILEQEAQLFVIPDLPQAFQWYTDMENSLLTLFGFLSGHGSQMSAWRGLMVPEEHKGKGRHVEENNAEARHFREQLPACVADVLDPLLPFDLDLLKSKEDLGPGEERADLLTGRASSPEMGQLLNRWFNLESKLRQPVGLLLAATRQDAYYVESRLSNLMQGLEALYRILYPDDSAFLPKQEFKQLRAELSAALPEWMDAKRKQEFLNRLGNINRKSLTSQLEILFDACWPMLSRTTELPNALALAKEVGSLRNVLAHALEEGATSRSQVLRMSRMVGLLSQVLRYHFLLLLGWESVAAMKTVSDFMPPPSVHHGSSS